MVLPPMSMFRRPEKMKVSEIEALAGLRPLHDPVFSHLLEGALAGRVPVYSCEIPPGLIRPFDRDYAPSRHPVGRAAIQDTIRRWVQGDVHKVWVYQEEQHFVLSDDYIVWEAVKQGPPAVLPCWLLGTPSNASIRHVQAPFQFAVIKRLLSSAA